MNVEHGETIWEPSDVARAKRKVGEPAGAVTFQKVLVSYLRVLQGKHRPEIVLAYPMGFTGDGKGVGHILRGERDVRPHHLQSISQRWGLDVERMFKDMWQVTKNLTVGDPPETGINLPDLPDLSHLLKSAGQQDR